ncbi:PKD domain-containing protein [Alteromonas sp. H39]|uniref:PKD domain-containing protein n=1 Tax=Alteromonas sp. H39 TaxID=3389876 RepID=UPI0039DFAB8D
MFKVTKLIQLGVCVCAASVISACGGSSGSDTSTQTNRAPTASVSGDTLVNPAASVSLNGSGSSDSDGTISTYSWTQLSGPTVDIADSSASQITFIAPETQGATLEFELTVTDDDGASRSDSIAITVNSAPEVSVSGDMQGLEESVLHFESAVSDADENVTTYAWTQTSGPAASIASASGEETDITLPLVSEDTEITFQLLVTDELGLSSAATFTVTVGDIFVNTPPDAVISGDTLLNPGADVAFDGSDSTDVDGAIASYAWTQTAGPAVELTNADQTVVSFTAPDEQGAVVELTLTVTDEYDDSDTASISATINSAPVISISGPSEAVETTTIALDGAATSDADDNIVSYQWTQESGPQVTIGSPTSSSTSLTLPVVEDDTVAQFALGVVDALGLASSKTVNVTILANEPPEVTLAFPPQRGRFYDDTLRIRGGITDDRNLELAEVTVEANNTEYDVIRESDESYSASVPVSISDSELTVNVSATDNIGETSEVVSSTLNIAVTIEEGLLALDSTQSNIAYIASKTNNNYRILEWNMADNAMRVLHEPQTATTPVSGQLKEMKYDSNSNRLFMLMFADSNVFTTLSLDDGSVSELIPAGGSGVEVNQVVSFSLSADGNTAYLLDDGLDALIEADINNETMTIVSDDTTGTGLGFELSYQSNVFVRNNGSVVVYDGELHHVYSVDTATGNRTIVSSSAMDVGAGPDINFWRATYNSDEDTMAGLGSQNRLYSIDLSTGDRELVAAFNDELQGAATDLLWDAENSRYLTSLFRPGSNSIDRYTENKIAALTAAGNINVLFEDNVGTGDKRSMNADIHYSATDGTLYGISQDSLSGNTDALVAFDIATLTTTELAYGSAELDSVSHIAVHPNGGDIYFTNESERAIYRYDIAADTTTKLTDVTDGTNPDLLLPTDMAINESGSDLYLTVTGATDGPALIQVTLSDASTRIVTNNTIGTNSSLIAPRSLLIADDVAYVGNNGNGDTATVNLQEIDLSTGDTVIATDNNSFPGSIFINSFDDLLLSEDGETLLVVNNGSIAAVELATGEKTLISANLQNFGKGELVNFTKIAKGTSANTVFAVDSLKGAVYLVNTMNGDRVMVQRQ